MTIETTAVQGYNYKISINAQDVSGQSNSVSLSPAKQVDDVTPFGDAWKNKMSGIKEWKVSVKAFYNEENAEAMEEFWDAWDGAAAVAAEMVPAGGTSGDWSFSGNVHVADLAIEAAPDGGPIAVTANLEGTGALTKGAVT